MLKLLASFPFFLVYYVLKCEPYVKTFVSRRNSVHGLVQFIQRCLTFCCIYVGDICVVLMDNHCIKFRPSVSNDCDSFPPYSLYTSTVFAVDVYTIESPLLKCVAPF